MIDFDLLRQTTEVAVGTPFLHLVWMTTFLTLVFTVPIIFMVRSVVDRQTYFLYALVASGVLVFGMHNLAEFIFGPAKETQPSAEAITASEEAYDQVVEAVTDSYTVKVTSASDCDSGLAKIFRKVTDEFWTNNVDEKVREHYDRVQFLEEAVSPDFTSNPQLLLETPNGVVTCYSVQYDQTTGAATLRVGGENADAVAPRTLKRD